jgi:hypothetical protein
MVFWWINNNYHVPQMLHHPNGSIRTRFGKLPLLVNKIEPAGWNSRMIVVYLGVKSLSSVTPYHDEKIRE